MLLKIMQILNIESLTSFYPELQLKDTESSIKSKLICLLA